MNRIAAGIAFALSSPTVLASTIDVAPTIRGDDVIVAPKSEYDDYLVKISTSSGGCGGGLIGGRYIVTAAHCAETEGTVYIRQGAELYHSSSKSYSVNYTLHTAQRGKEYAERLTYIKSMYTALGYLSNPTFRLSSYWDFVLDDEYINEILSYSPDQAIGTETGYSFVDHRGNKYPLFLDLAILELETPVPHNSSFALGFVRDDNYKQTIPTGQPFTFRGWGLTDYESDSLYSPYKLMQGQINLVESELDDNCLSEEGRTDFTYCYPLLRPSLALSYESDLGQGVGSGDSGTPLILDNVAYGVASTATRSSNIISRFYEFAPHKNLILDAVNEVITPNLDTIDVPVVGNGKQYRYIIQNLTTGMAKVDINESGSDIAEGYATITHDCSAELTSFEYCTVDIDVRSAGYGTGSYSGLNDFEIVKIDNEPRVATFDIPNVNTLQPVEDGSSFTSKGTKFTVSTADNPFVITSHAYDSLYIEFNTASGTSYDGVPNFNLRDSNDTIFGQCTGNQEEETATCFIKSTDMTAISSYAAHDFTLYQGETAINDLTVRVVSEPQTAGGHNGNGNDSGGSGGSTGFHWFALLLTMGLYRRKQRCETSALQSNH